jgi:hypothetical protein
MNPVTKDIIKDMAVKALRKKFGKIEIYKTGSTEFWRVNDLILKPYFDVKQATCVFSTGFSRSTISKVEDEKALFAAFKYYKQGLTAFFFSPKTIIDNYIKAGVPMRKKGDCWMVSVKHEDSKLFFYRSKSQPAHVVQDDNNFYENYSVTKEDFMEMDNSIASKNERKEIKEAVLKNPGKSLKLCVKGPKGQRLFTCTSPLVFGTLQILSKAKFPLSAAEISDGLLEDYAVLSRGQTDNATVNNILTKLRKTGSVDVQDNYKRNRKFFLTSNYNVTGQV